jgi:hypothetical protein
VQLRLQGCKVECGCSCTVAWFGCSAGCTGWLSCRVARAQCRVGGVAFASGAGLLSTHRWFSSIFDVSRRDDEQEMRRDDGRVKEEAFYDLKASLFLGDSSHDDSSESKRGNDRGDGGSDEGNRGPEKAVASAPRPARPGPVRLD